MAEPVDTYVAWCRYTDKTVVTCGSDAEGAFRVYRHADSSRVHLLEKYEAAVHALLNAEHYDHFAARMSDSELEAIETMKSLAAWQEFVSTPTAPAAPPAVFNRPECPFNYCDQPAPHAACQVVCHHAPMDDSR